MVRLSNAGTRPSDGDDERLRKAALTLYSSLITVLATAWVVTYLALGLTLSALIPLAYQCASITSLVIFFRTKRFGPFRTIQLSLMLVLPFVLQWSLGGFRASSLVALWAFTAPAGALMFEGAQRAAPWFVAFVALVSVSSALDPTLSAHAATFPTGISLVFFVMNLVGVTGTTFLILLYFVAERERIHAALELEKHRSELLLLNVLPEPIAERLKRSQTLIADAFPEVSILFADIVGFTPMSATMEPQALVAMLNEIFTRFDVLAERHGLEKIKTIGDAYMVAGGVPQARPDHAQAACQMALDMIAECERLPAAFGRGLSLRIGIDSGPAVAGVIGSRKFIYDLWGNTVNTASRMESHGRAGCIQVTERTYRLVKDAYDVSAPGTVDVKGIGPMVTYMVVGPRLPALPPANGAEHPAAAPAAAVAPQPADPALS